MAALTPDEILGHLPRARPSRFIDAILEMDSQHIVTKYTWREEDCAGHFPGNPVVPGVKMLEMAEQSALVCWGVYLQGDLARAQDSHFTRVERIFFKKSVRPGETVRCRGTFGKHGSFANGRLTANVELYFDGGPQDGEVILAGAIAGLWAPQDSEKLS